VIKNHNFLFKSDLI